MFIQNDSQMKVNMFKIWDFFAPVLKNWSPRVVDAICDYFQPDVKPEDVPLALIALLKLTEDDEVVKYLKPKLPVLKQVIHGLKIVLTQPNFLKVELKLNGEPSPIEIVINYRKYEENKKLMVEILSIQATKPWIETLLNEFIIEIFIPEDSQQKIELEPYIYHILR